MWRPTPQKRAPNPRQRFDAQPRIPRMPVMAQLMEHPAVAVPRVGKQGEPCVMVIFGAAGDLTGRKLIPALYNLAKADLLPKEFAVVGGARSPVTNEEFRTKILEEVEQNGEEEIVPTLWESCSRRFYYFKGDFSNPELFPQLKDFLAQIDRDHST